MKQVVKIAGKEVERIEYRNYPVITLGKIDELHERASGTAKRNFRENRSRFIENEDFFEVQYDEWTQDNSLIEEDCLVVRNSSDQTSEQNQDVTKGRGGHRGSMIFLTQSGYLMLTKSFKDDLSWEVHRQLVKCYFALKSGSGDVDGVDILALQELQKEVREAKRLYNMIANGMFFDIREYPVKTINRLISMMRHTIDSLERRQEVEDIRHNERLLVLSELALSNPLSHLVRSLK